MCRCIDAIGWATHGSDPLAKAQVPKANPTCCSLLSMLQSNNSVFDSVHEHAGSNPQISRAETTQVSYRYKIRQT